MLCHYAQLSSSMHVRLFGSMDAYLVGLEALDLSLRSNFCICLRLHAPYRLSSLCAQGHDNGSEVCVSSQCPGERAHTRLSC